MEDFYITAKRMFKDSEVLNLNNRWFGACYFLGYVVECYCKIILFTYRSISYEQFKKFYKHDLKKLNDEILILTVMASPPAKYIIDLTVDCPNIYTGAQKWNPEKRYCCDSGLWDQNTISESFTNEATKVYQILDQMKLDGVI